ncbi:MAG: envelope stress response membrane protein PspB [Novosphingobium sp. 17-62-19]|uniref:envelope stress response membrane protein PspB n=1 Tax=Novosphingobium sp. 17-62-19 TaxID=1970406 RepID=UPI000BD3D6B8|nr:envelope stress response membrane protein PspB [Novosphingobium sp. 17-62-19]OYX90853.1 MAG: envelope stress response membrane protein PspB [Novosphingobium sp. 35-62-5]OZA18788.1 MAG: envelope stress response membrane protein PspB [Novosphingobium sp. 17-62-19]HQS96308.1 envelope stress response membrane protein PspB [Novosphingobium sp.]
MEDVLVPIGVVGMLFVGLPWLILHYITKWKTAPTLTSGDEALLEELYQLAKRLDDRMDTVERLVAADNPEFKPARIMHDRETDNQKLAELDRMFAEQGRTVK